MRYLALIVPILLLAAFPAFGAASYLGGLSGNILTPDAVIVPQGGWEVSYHQFIDLLNDIDDLTTWGVTYGLMENLEVGVTFADNSDSETAVNAKLRLVPETSQRPAVIVGVFDVAGTVDFIDDDPGFFVLISKNITPTATEIAGEPSKPLRLSIGAGSGVFNGLFAGLDWTLEQRISLMAEFFGGEIGGDENFFNAGIRFAATDALRLDAATIDFDDFAFGANYRLMF